MTTPHNFKALPAGDLIALIGAAVTELSTRSIFGDADAELDDLYAAHEQAWDDYSAALREYLAWKRSNSRPVRGTYAEWLA